MAVLHRALFTWFLLLIFLILVVLRLDEKTSWNWFIVFIPMWIFDCVLLAYVLLKLITQCKHPHQQQQQHQAQLQRGSTSGGGGGTTIAAGTSNTATATSSSTATVGEGLHPTTTTTTTTVTRRSRTRFSEDTGGVAINRCLLYLFGIVTKIIFQAVLCFKLENIRELSLYYVFVPLWIVLLGTSADVFTDLVKLYRSNIK